MPENPPFDSKEETAHLWYRLKEQGDEKARDELIEYYIPFVQQIAGFVLKKLWVGVELDDLVSDGYFGLMRAIDNFEPSRGYKFETYASQVIRGSIYNGLRSLDWVPERTRGKARAMQRTTDNFFKEYGRAPSQDELAKELKVSASEVYDLIANLSCIYMLSLDQPIMAGDGEDTCIMSVVESEDLNNPLMEFEFKEEREHMQQAIENLNEREQYIIIKHYFEGITLDTISKEFGISKQRVSQMHARAISRIREYLGRMTISDEAIKDFVPDEQLFIPPRWKSNI